MATFFFFFELLALKHLNVKYVFNHHAQCLVGLVQKFVSFCLISSSLNPQDIVPLVQWEARTGQLFYNLPPAEREKANVEISAAKQPRLK